MLDKLNSTIAKLHNSSISSAHSFNVIIRTKRIFDEAVAFGHACEEIERYSDVDYFAIFMKQAPQIIRPRK